MKSQKSYLSERGAISAEEASLHFAVDPDDRVMTLSEWRALRRISQSTQQRLFAAGLGPRVTHLSARRKGITVKHDREWLAERSASAS